MNKTIRVWDPLVRIFHWSLVVAFFVSYFSGDEESTLHIYAGYAVLALILFRLIWGVIGDKYSRFSNFVCSPKKAFEYLAALKQQKAKHYLGHNPAGAWMIILLLLSLFVVTVSGLKVYAIEEGKGPLAQNAIEISLVGNALASEDDDDDKVIYKPQGNSSAAEHEEEFWEEIHEFSANFTLFLVFLHVAGVVVSSKAHRENLVKAMFTGKKTQK